MDQFCERLKSLRKKNGLSQAEFAAEIGINTRSQGNYESGKRVPDVEYLLQLERFGVDFNNLILGTNVTSSLSSIDLAYCIGELEKVLDDAEAELPAELKAKLIVFLYEERISGEEINNEKIARHLRLVS